jgi:hypothetical protein
LLLVWLGSGRERGEQRGMGGGGGGAAAAERAGAVGGGGGGGGGGDKRSPRCRLRGADRQATFGRWSGPSITVGPAGSTFGEGGARAAVDQRERGEGAAATAVAAPPPRSLSLSLSPLSRSARLHQRRRRTRPSAPPISAPGTFKGRDRRRVRGVMAGGGKREGALRPPLLLLAPPRIVAHDGQVDVASIVCRTSRLRL